MLYHSLAAPSAGIQAHSNVQLEGYCFRADGEPVEALRAWRGEEKLTLKRKQSRRILAMLYPENPAAAKSGYVVELMLRRGRNVVRVEAKVGGAWQDIEKLVLHVPWFSFGNKQAGLLDENYEDAMQRWLDDGSGLPEPCDAAKSDSAGDQRFFSIVMPVFNPELAHLEEAIASVVGQSWSDWELIAVNDASTDQRIGALLARAAEADQRIRVITRSENGHIAAATNDGLGVASGRWIVFMDHDDTLEPLALGVLARVIQENPNARLLYSDEDHMDASGARKEPSFKPCFQRELLWAQNYLCHLVACEAALVAAVGGLRRGFEGAQDWDFVLRATEMCQPGEVVHIPRILYHWRETATSTSGKGGQAKPYAIEAGRRAVAEAVSAAGYLACEVVLDNRNRPRVLWPLPKSPPLVSLVIPTRNGEHLLRQCLSSLEKRNSYSPVEVVIVDNGSDEPSVLKFFSELESSGRAKVVTSPGDFNFSRLVNLGVGQARGDIVMLVNNDIEFVQEDALREMVSQALRPDIGLVGAKLLYPDGRIQHAGVFLGYNGSAGHYFRGCSADWEGCWGRGQVSWRVSAVTAAMMAVRKEVFQAVGGFDEEAFPVVYNDVDFCLRVEQMGLATLQTPHAVFIHHESATRGRSSSATVREEASWKALLDRHREKVAADPNYHPALSLAHEDLRPARAQDSHEKLILAR